MEKIMAIIFLIFDLLLVDIKLFILKCRLRFLSFRLHYDISDLFKTKNSVSNFKLTINVNNALIETCYPGYAKKYLTSIIHPAFDEGCFLVVEEYENQIEAEAGHKKWIKTFEKWLPQELKDLVTDKVYKRDFIDYCDDYFEEDFE